MAEPGGFTDGGNLTDSTWTSPTATEGEGVIVRWVFASVGLAMSNGRAQERELREREREAEEDRGVERSEVRRHYKWRDWEWE